MSYVFPNGRSDPAPRDFVFSFEPLPDITAFELATIVQLGVGDGRGFKVAPIDVKYLAEDAISAYRHLRQWDTPARENWPIRKYRPSLKRAA